MLGLLRKNTAKLQRPVTLPIGVVVRRGRVRSVRAVLANNCALPAVTGSRRPSRSGGRTSKTLTGHSVQSVSARKLLSRIDFRRADWFGGIVYSSSVFSRVGCGRTLKIDCPSGILGSVSSVGSRRRAVWSSNRDRRSRCGTCSEWCR